MATSAGLIFCSLGMCLTSVALTCGIYVSSTAVLAGNGSLTVAFEKMNTYSSISLTTYTLGQDQFPDQVDG